MPKIKLPDGTEIDLPYGPGNGGDSKSGPVMRTQGAAPNQNQMQRAAGFMGMGQKRRATTQGGPSPMMSGFPAGLNFGNMVGFARTPAGKAVIMGILERLRAGQQAV